MYYIFLKNHFGSLWLLLCSVIYFKANSYKAQLMATTCHEHKFFHKEQRNNCGPNVQERFD